MSKKYLEINNTDEIILVDSIEKNSKYRIKYINGNLKIEEVKDNGKKLFSIEEINLSTLKCLSSLESFLSSCSPENISNEALDNINSLYDFMYNKINNKQKINYENLIDTKYYKVTSYITEN